MAGVPRSTAGPFVRLVYRLSRRRSRAMAAGGAELPIEPIELFAHNPRLLFGYGMLEQSFASRPRVDAGLRALAPLQSAVMQGCEFCRDIGSQEARRAGVPEAQLMDLHRYRESDRFDARERLVLDLAVAMTSTPVRVDDELFSALREHFDEAQMVELISLVALENLRSRFNAAFGIEAAGFSGGAACALMETSPAPDGARQSTPAAPETAAAAV
ncbi:MAG: carboxymuconolactone decarboxylase family protein [Acidobacteriota bacterium]|nr:carboxymuconolactone decarboxylase family protein [Acidobacteriota bacterium]